MAVTNYVWDGDQYLMETDETNTTQAVFTNEPDEFTNLISQRRGGASQFAHFDAVGSTRQVTDDSEVVTDQRIYGGFGNMVSHTGTTEFPFWFVGKFGYYYDPETDTNYVIHRILEPENGRWLSEDPFRFSDYAYTSSYIYGLNNPLVYVDPFGRDDRGIIEIATPGKGQWNIRLEHARNLEDCAPARRRPAGIAETQLSITLGIDTADFPKNPTSTQIWQVNKLEVTGIDTNCQVKGPFTLWQLDVWTTSQTAVFDKRIHNFGKSSIVYDTFTVLADGTVPLCMLSIKTTSAIGFNGHTRGVLHSRREGLHFINERDVASIEKEMRGPFGQYGIDYLFIDNSNACKKCLPCWLQKGLDLIGAKCVECFVVDNYWNWEPGALTTSICRDFQAPAIAEPPLP